MKRLWWSVVAVSLGGCPEPQFSGPPTITVGTGTFAYEDVEEEQQLEIDAGPQGGHHVWLGVRTTGLDPRQLRLDTQLYSAPAGEDEVIEGESFFFFPQMFEGAESGVWETAGLPHQVNRGEVANRRFRLEVIATDQGGRTAEDSAIIVPVR